MATRVSARILVALLLAASLALGVGCDAGECCQGLPGADGGVTPPTDTGAQPDTGGEVRACVAELPGKAFRFTKMLVTEPSEPRGLPDFLNGIWVTDVANYVLNIALRIDTVDVESGALTFTGGSGWHDVEMTDLYDGPPPIPTTYKFVGVTDVLVAEFQDDQRIKFRTDGNSRIMFHPGPDEHPNLCSADYSHSIPIETLVAEGELSDDCTRIVNGKLWGCITKDAACSICSWGPAPDYSTWSMSPDETASGDPCTQGYCRRWCGSPPNWTNFQVFLQFVQAPLTCDVDGDGVLDGYQIAGTWEGALVPFE